MDYNRLTKVIKWNLISNKHQIMRNATGFTFAFCIIVMAQCGSYWGSQECPDLSSSTSLIFVCAFVYLMYAASQVCFNMRTKTTLLNYAMLPATNGEKYLANVLYQTVVVIGTILFAVIVTDALQAVISLISCGHASSLLFGTFGFVTHDFGFMGHVASAILLCIITHAAFVLGGTFFRRHQFLYTVIVMIVVPTVLSTVLGIIAAGSVYLIYDAGYNVAFEWLLGDTVTEVLLNVVLLLIAAGFYYLGYRCFCRIQVINNKAYN